MPHPRAWTEKEDAAVRLAYTAGRGLSEACAMVPGRSRNSIAHRAVYLRVSKCGRWTARQNAELVDKWDVMTPDELAQLFGRTRGSILQRARRLRLTFGRTQGLEYLHQAAERTGFSPQTLRGILDHFRVHVHRRTFRTETPVVDMRLYDPDAVDDAIASFFEYERVSTVCERYGCARESLGNWLKKHKIRTVRFGGFRRSPEYVLKRDVEPLALHLVTTESLKNAAKRLHINRPTLRRLIAEAGFKRVGKQFWRIKRTDYDRIVAEYRARQSHPVDTAA